MVVKKKKLLKSRKKKIVLGIVHINSTFNNTIVTVTDLYGNTIAWASAGSVGFKGARKGTPFAAQAATEKAIRDVIELGLLKVEILIKINLFGNRENPVFGVPWGCFGGGYLQRTTSGHRS